MACVGSRNHHIIHQVAEDRKSTEGVEGCKNRAALETEAQGLHNSGHNWPVSLLPTLGKALESLLATRIACLAEEYCLLPKTHFGARK
jgi:hypothetical protein